MNNPWAEPTKPNLQIPAGITLPEKMWHEILAVQPDLANRTDIRVVESSALAFLQRHFITTPDDHPQIKELFEQVPLLALETDPVLIQGETGTGKGIVAEALSHGRPGRFITLNVTSLPDYLVESELFGHVKGSFTGADRDKEGLLESAKDGTVLLDEIGDMPLTLQPKLLRAVQQKVVRRVGDNNDRPISCRFLCATHRDLEAMTKRWEETGGKEGFRLDLFWRLAVYRLQLPRLDERPATVINAMLAAMGCEWRLERVPTMDGSYTDPILKLNGGYRELYAFAKRWTLRKKLQANRLAQTLRK